MSEEMSYRAAVTVVLIDHTMQLEDRRLERTKSR